jgi:hypothetical protein
MKQHAAPITVTMLLLAPLVYLATYLALVVPEGRPYAEFYCNACPGVVSSSYRVGDEWPAFIFWPLERGDRKLRPAAWPEEFELGINFDE